MAHLAPVQTIKRRRQAIALPPPVTPSAKTLVKALMSLKRTLSSAGKPTVCQCRNASNVVRRIELLATLFEEIEVSDRPFPPSAVISLRELYRLMQRTYMLLEECREISRFWLLMEQGTYAQYFYEITQSLGKILSSIPLELLDLSEEVMEQTELVRAQAIRARFVQSPAEVQLREDVVNMLKLVEREETPQPSQLKCLFNVLYLLNAANCETEIHKLEEISTEESRLQDLNIQDRVAGLISFVRYGKYVLYSGEFEGVEDEVSRVHSRSRRDENRSEVSTSESDKSAAMVVPPIEYLCSITLDLMRDPVIVATGQTYERSSITRWIHAGHSTCPKTRQKLAHLDLITNYALKSLISQWCEDNNVEFENGTQKDNGKGVRVQRIHNSGGNLEATKLAVTFLVQKLATGNECIQKQVVRELRLLSKSGEENRICIAEAGAIPHLLPLLSSSDVKTQEHTITTVLNLSTVEDNRRVIVAADALDLVIEVLKSGHTMEAQENAAALLFSLSSNDEVKVQIGSKLDAIPSLVTLLREGSMHRGKRDAVNALMNLARYHGNKAKIIEAGAVPFLVAFFRDESPSTLDSCAALLALLASHPEGVDAMFNANAISMYVPLLQHGSPKGREYAISILLAMCQSQDKKVIDEVFQHLNEIVPYLYNLLSIGTLRAKRKVAPLLKLFRS
ncbi:U-box domain-containing protein 1 [Physcomitrium patens]|uniref:RING-type E3 ubiquitin transferase n=1 Tax=Physcomitrium patens TaxID=3218 RepID=A0A2K1JM74_PHYPA|nr:U-box domain-containing protein 1-like [Physcomitrium patens]PNR42641.1 hypothetical protein PHYPA_017471 [Physcomitrium patens]|eukprot:XP_024392890.1 U-box domain-containing protein 1-like [Physcomitrella patens]